MWVKICANTSLGDARFAAELGADAVGFVFAPSTRRVSVEAVAAITPELPESVERIGVFTAGSPAEIASAAAHAGLTGVQLHGSFTAEFVDALERESEGALVIIRTLHWPVEASPDVRSTLARELRESGEREPAQRVLLDSSLGAATGGTGISFAWTDAAFSLTPVRGMQRLIIAGGLRGDNVAEAIQALQPWGVDVASGVEASPGKKDLARLRDFIERARAAC